MRTKLLDIRNCDCMDLIREYPDNYFELAIVDPPYGIGCAKTINIPNPKRSFSGERHHQSKTWDDAPPKSEYFEELRRVSVNQIIWGGNYFNLPITKSWIFWHKKDTPEQGSHFSDGELAWTSFKTVTRYFKHGWIGLDYINNRGVDYKIHPTQKPVALYKWLLQNYAKEGDKILDTHMGSGSIAIACHYMGFNLTACELDKEYFDAACERIKRETAQTELNL